MHSAQKKSAAEVALTVLHAGGKFDSKVYETSGGLHGVGVSVANALSERMEVEVAREQQLYRMAFERGKPKGKLEKIGRAPNRRGTKVRFRPDPEIFGPKAAFRPERIFKMTRSKAYLFGGVEIRWSCDKALLAGVDDVPEQETFHFERGLTDFLTAALHGTTLIHPDIFAGMIEVDNVYVGKPIYTTSVEGTAEASVAYTRVWGKHALLLYTPAGPMLEAPAAGYTVVWNRVPAALQYIKKMRDEEREVDIIEGNTYYQQKQIVSKAGAFCANVVS
jgi:DNA gyrase/topoisomerase IV subunit B